MTLFKKQSHRIILILVLAALILKSYYSEKLLPNEGFGWDGYVYANLTWNFKFNFENHLINRYYFQRIGLPFMLNTLFTCCGIEFTNPNILKAYSFVNIVFIGIAVVFFFLTSKTLNISRNVEILCFSLLFFCFPILKFSLYYPLLMDVPAFSIAMVLLYLYVKKKMFPFFIVILSGCFVFPNFIILCSLFFFKFPGRDQAENLTSENKSPQSKKLILSRYSIFYVLFCFTIPLIYLYFFRVTINTELQKIFPHTFDSETMNLLLFWSSFGLALLYVIFLNRFPLNYFDFKKVFKSINVLGIFLTLIVFIGVQQVIAHFSSYEKGYITVNDYMFYVITQSIKNPFNFIIAHVFYLGIAPLLCIFILKDLKQEIMNFGFGMVLFFNIVIYFSVGSESRQLLNYYPFIILLIMLALDKKWEISLSFSITCSILCLALSHFWFTINTGLTATSDYSGENILKFPLQRYFMFQGPWVSNYMYLVHLGVCVLLIILLWACLKKGLIQRKQQLSNP